MKETAWMNQDGVGCESCHGPAENWLGPHTGREWKFISAADKYERFGFIDTKNLVSRIELCASCHIGQDGRDGLPLRDVNHDLIAAGHPRLYFEFTAYHENQPKHWQATKAPAVEAAVDFSVRAWALGQLVSARAALELLGSRSARALVPPSTEPTLPPALPRSAAAYSPWPEFAEYGCFSCHHSLADESWRRNRRSSGVPAGAPQWGTWYFPIAGELVANSPGIDDLVVKRYQSALASVVQEMSRSNPSPDKARTSVDASKSAVDAIIREFSTGPASSRSFNASGVEHMIDVLNRREAWSNVANWDEAAQRYLALVPLNQVRGRWDAGRRADQQALSDELHLRLKSLTFPKGFDSPQGFDPARLPARQNERTNVPAQE